ncbi:MAG: HEAT repeat domain-containing protein, partial [Candidatus Thorarchaeota archaeon]
MSETRRMLLDFETDEVGQKARNDSKVRKALIKALTDTSDIVRERALIATIELGDPTIVTDVAKALKDDDDEVRIAAAESLAYYQQPSTIPTLLEGLKDSNTWVRSHCANGLSKLVSGPIWARVKEEDVDRILADFPEMDEEQIRLFLTNLKIRQNSLDKFMRWRKANFEVDIDTSSLEEMESKPLILEGVELEPPVKSKPATGISDDVERILSELPADLRETLPEEDLRRL